MKWKLTFFIILSSFGASGISVYTPLLTQVLSPRVELIVPEVKTFPGLILVPNKPIQESSSTRNLDLLDKIAWCESRGTHFDKFGNTLRGTENSNDIGKFQINSVIHFEKAKEMGLNIFKESDNEKYARFLFETQGFSPWMASYPCWSEFINKK